jgi:hypothetical protein
MILKYKMKNGAWRFITLNDFTVAKIDITDTYNKHIDEETGKVELVYCGGKDTSREIIDLFYSASFYKLNDSNKYEIFNDNIINKYMNYIVISYNEKFDLILYDEAYLMSDEGKTIEKLM